MIISRPGKQQEHQAGAAPNWKKAANESAIGSVAAIHWCRHTGTMRSKPPATTPP